MPWRAVATDAEEQAFWQSSEKTGRFKLRDKFNPEITAAA
jgi:hypothetical protein